PVVAGYASHGLREDLVLARLTTGGVLDQGFGTGGVTSVPGFDPPGNSDHAQGETVAFAGADPIVAGFRRADGDLASTRALVLRFEGGGAVCGAAPAPPPPTPTPTPPGGQTGGGAILPVPRFTISQRAALPNSLSFNGAVTSV